MSHSTKTDKRDKEYLQYSLDFAVSDVFQRSSLSKQGAVLNLFGMLEELHFVCAGLFFRAIDSDHRGSSGDRAAALI